jgi:hypothetical protein
MCGTQDSGVIGEEGGDGASIKDLHDRARRGVFTAPSDVRHRPSTTGRLE